MDDGEIAPKGSPLRSEPEGDAHAPVDAVEILHRPQYAALVHAGGEIHEMHRQALRQVDGAFAMADQAAQPALGPRRAQDDVGQAERLVDAHAAVAERAPLRPEKVAARRIVQIDSVLVREHELDETERVAL